jgi:hypothetical protein
MLLKGDQMPSVPIVVGDRVQVIAVSTPGQASSGSSTVGTSLVASAIVLAIGLPSANQTQYAANVSLEIPAASAAEVAGYAAADQIAITLTSGHAT